MWRNDNIEKLHSHESKKISIESGISKWLTVKMEMFVIFAVDFPENANNSTFTAIKKINQWQHF